MYHCKVLIFGKIMDTFWDSRILTLEESNWCSLPLSKWKFISETVSRDYLRVPWNRYHIVTTLLMLKENFMMGLHLSSATVFLSPFSTWAANFPPVSKTSDGTVPTLSSEKALLFCLPQIALCKNSNVI